MNRFFHFFTPFRAGILVLCMAFSGFGQTVVTIRNNSAFVAASDLAAWAAAMGAHASQLATRNYVELQLARARVSGLRAGVAYAQALYPNDALVFASLDALVRSARQF